MISTKLLSIILVLPGILFLFASYMMTRRMDQRVPEQLLGKWVAMTYLILFFLAGYISYIIIQLSNIKFALELVTSTVFLGGSIFVFLVIKLTRTTLDNVREGEKRVREAHDSLLLKNVELENEITARRTAEGQAKTRLRYLSTLHAIDLMITSSLDLNVTMEVFLDQIVPELNVGAASVLLLNHHTQTLEFGTGHGFEVDSIKKTKERLGEGSAGTAALQKRTVHIADLSQKKGEFKRSSLIEGENFISYYAVPLIAKGQVNGVLEIFYREAVEADQELSDFLESLALQAAIAIDNASMFNELQTSNAELILAYDTTIEGWSHALELRDEETEGHTKRVTEMTVRAATKLGLREEKLAHIRRGALLHDIGKMGISDSILMKTGPLTDEERETMKSHPVFAFEMLSPISYLKPALDIPYCHHEKWDGTGYPRGLKEEQIPLAARIFAMADIWDALTSERRYHKPWPREKVVEHIRSLAGSHFDPNLVDLFLSTVKEMGA